jgi:hypothetical protein
MSALTVITGRESLDDIFSGFAKTKTRLETFIAQQDEAVERLDEQERALVAKRNEAIKNAERAKRGLARVSEFIG